LSLIFQKPPFTYQYQVGVENDVDYDNDDVIITGAISNAPLGSVVLQSGALIRDGQRLFICAGGRQTGTGSKTFLLRVNGSNLFSSNAITPANNTGWFLRSELFRRSNNSLHVETLFVYNTGDGAGGAAPLLVSGVNISFSSINDIAATLLTFEMLGTIVVAAETIRQTKMSLSVL